MPSSGAVQKDRKEVAFIKETNTFGRQVGAVRHQATYRFANFVAYKIYVRIPGQLRVKYNTQMPVRIYNSNINSRVKSGKGKCRYHSQSMFSLKGIPDFCV